MAVTERKRLIGFLEQNGVTKDARRWLRREEAKTLAAITDAGEATASQLTKVVPELAIQIPISVGKRYETTVGVSTRVLNLMGMEGVLVRARPTGRWTSSRHRWAALDPWLGPPLAAIPVDEARAELVRRWLDRFGPGTLADLKWWTGWTMGATRKAVADVDIEEVDLDGTPGLVLADDPGPPTQPEPWVALLPALDPTTMGWQARAWYLGDHKTSLFDTNGNAGPTVWVDGRVVGGWAQRKTGEVVVKLLEDVPRRRAQQVDEEARRLADLLGDVRVVPRFRTPLDKELSA